MLYLFGTHAYQTKSAILKIFGMNTCTVSEVSSIFTFMHLADAFIQSDLQLHLHLCT